MNTETEHTLVPSTNWGRYALDDSEHGQDVTSGQVIAILLDGHWIEGSVEHASSIYAIEEYLSAHHVKSGYYFTARNGGICGLCAGMQVRVI